MLALARRLNVVSSSKMTPSAELAEVLSVSPLKISSLTLSAELAPLRVVVALPCTVTTVPIEAGAVVSGAAGVAGAAGEAAGGAGAAGAGVPLGACASFS